MSTKWADRCWLPLCGHSSLGFDMDAHALDAGVDQGDRELGHRILGLDQNVLAVVDLDVVLGGQCALESVADVFGDIVLRSAVLDRHFYVFDSPPTGVTAKRMVPSEFALSLTSIRQRCDAFASAAIAAVPARIAAAIAAAAQPRCLLLIMTS